MRAWLVPCALFAVSLPALAQDFPGKIIYSVEVVEWALERNADGSKGPKRKTGIFCHHKEAGPGQFELASLTCYQLRNGEVIAIAGGGAGFLKKLQALPIASFDVDKEMKATRQKQRANGVGEVGVLDGARYRIRYDFNGASIDYTGWNPGPVIDHMAPDSVNLGNLKQLIDFIALNLGRMATGLVPLD